ncbi:Uncharacterized protein APZ42_008448 [Daphnia magna]|uniref:Uncharacterized protein n=1 Tax=Daphnia magna TaxID=35525 RepID=A0A164EML2_9CRUS|nr:Uncharacterized protein APZ42_008448 [Daphnia magna]
MPSPLQFSRIDVQNKTDIFIPIIVTTIRLLSKGGGKRRFAIGQI